VCVCVCVCVSVHISLLQPTVLLSLDVRDGGDFMPPFTSLLVISEVMRWRVLQLGVGRTEGRLPIAVSDVLTRNRLWLFLSSSLLPNDSLMSFDLTVPL
jgi:hypothetical protein